MQTIDGKIDIIGSTLNCTKIEKYARVDCWSLYFSENSGMYLSCDSKALRFTITGMWPTFENQEFAPETRPYITVSENKSALAIAREIEKRFLTRYWPALRAQEERIAEFRKTKHGTDSMIRAIEASVRCYRGRSPEDTEIRIRGFGWAKINVFEGGRSARLTMDMDRDMLLQVLAAISRFQNQ